MGITKAEKFTEEQNQLATIAKALGHPARIAILQCLIEAKSCITGYLVDELPLSQSTISQHLKELKQIGLIKGEIEGTSVNYCIDMDNWNAAKQYLNHFFDSNPQCGDNCC